jgi:hypothetical protein
MRSLPRARRVEWRGRRVVSFRSGVVVVERLLGASVYNRTKGVGKREAL